MRRRVELRLVVSGAECSDLTSNALLAGSICLQIADELIAANTRPGMKIRMILDKDTADLDSPLLIRLLDANIPIRLAHDVAKETVRVVLPFESLV